MVIVIVVMISTIPNPPPRSITIEAKPVAEADAAADVVGKRKRK